MEERNPGPEDAVVCAPAQLPALGQAGSWKSWFMERLQGCEPPGQVLAQEVRFGREHTWGWLWRFPKDAILSSGNGGNSEWHNGQGLSIAKGRGEKPGASKFFWGFEESQKIRKEAVGDFAWKVRDPLWVKSAKSVRAYSLGTAFGCYYRDLKWQRLKRCKLARVASECHQILGLFKLNQEHNGFLGFMKAVAASPITSTLRWESGIRMY